MLHILVDALPPEVHQGSQGTGLLADLGHGVVTGRQRMALRSHFDGLNRRLQVAFNLGGGLGS